MLWFLLILSCFSCTTFDHRDYKSATRSVLKPLVKELREIHDVKDMQKRSGSLKKKFYKIADILISTYGQEFCDDNKEDEVCAQLLLQLKRIYAISGCRQKMIEIQSDALLKLDKVHKRFNKYG